MRRERASASIARVGGVESQRYRKTKQEWTRGINDEDCAGGGVWVECGVRVAQALRPRDWLRQPHSASTNARDLQLVFFIMTQF